jgi:hypothetical protein
MEEITSRLYNQAFPDSQLQVVKIDVFPVTDKEKILLTFESKNSKWKQGVILCGAGELDVGGQRLPGVILWYETVPQQVQIQCFINSGLLIVYNVWDRGIGRNSQSHSSGMLVEEMEFGRRYRCNDIGFETNFDKLVFKIERVQDLV